MLALLVNAQLIIFWLFIYYIGINSIEFVVNQKLKPRASDLILVFLDYSIIIIRFDC